MKSSEAARKLDRLGLRVRTGGSHTIYQTSVGMIALPRRSNGRELNGALRQRVLRAIGRGS